MVRNRFSSEVWAVPKIESFALPQLILRSGVRFPNLLPL